MFEGVLSKLKKLTIESQYIVTSHAYDEMDDDGFSIWDVESALLGGKIIERQRDKATREYKYRLSGISLDKRSMEIVTKIGQTGKMIIITVYANK